LQNAGHYFCQLSNKKVIKLLKKYFDGVAKLNKCQMPTVFTRNRQVVEIHKLEIRRHGKNRKITDKKPIAYTLQKEVIKIFSPILQA
jgi:hypothetical protein